jgi:hypothetical protein
MHRSRPPSALGKFLTRVCWGGLTIGPTQHYCCVVLPALTKDGLLPPGIHLAEWDDVYATFGTTPHRRRLLDGFHRAMKALKKAGCKKAYLDGSFVTNKEKPGDFDGCWDEADVNPYLLDPILLTFANGRAAQRIKFGGELFPAGSIADTTTGSIFIDFFQIHKETGGAKGIIAIDLERLQP